MGWANDFINAFKTGYNLFDNTDQDYKRMRTKVLKAQYDRLIDPVRNKAEIARLNRAGVKDASAVRANNSRTEFYDQQQRILDEQQKWRREDRESARSGGGNSPYRAVDPLPGDKVLNPGANSGLNVGGSRRSAMPVGEGTDEEQLQAQDLAQDEEQDRDEQAYARGGAVRKVRNYAHGGAVDATDPEDEDGDTAEPDDDEDDASAERERSAAQVTAQGNQQDNQQGQPRFSMAAAHDAAREGILYNMKKTGADGEPQTGAVQHDEVGAAARQRAARTSYLSRAGAASPQDMEAIYNTIDPNGRMTEGQRSLAALAQVYTFKLKQGDYQGAQQAAASMMQYYGHMSDSYNALAKTAAEQGHVDDAMKFMLKSHANVPDGTQMYVRKREDGSYAFSWQDEASGKIYERGIASPNDVIKMATSGLVNMESMVANAAGLRTGGKGGASDKTGRSAKDAGVPKLSERKEWSDAIDEVKSPPDATPDETLAPSTKHFASQILGANHVSPADALAISTKAISLPDDYKIQMREGGRGGEMSTPDGRRIKLSDDAVDQLVSARAMSRQQDDKIATDAGSKARKAVEDEADQGIVDRRTATLPAKNEARKMRSIVDENRARREREQAISIGADQ